MILDCPAGGFDLSGLSFHVPSVLSAQNAHSRDSGKRNSDTQNALHDYSFAQVPNHLEPISPILLPGTERVYQITALFHAVAHEHLHHSRDSVGFGQAGVAPGGGEVVTQNVHFRQ